MSLPTPDWAATLDPAQVRVRELLRRMPSVGPAAVQELFCAELGYDGAQEALSANDWPDHLRGSLDGPAMILAQQRDGNGSFDVIHIPLVPSDQGQVLRATRLAERSIVNQLLEDHPLALFVFSEPTKQESHLVNVRHHARTAGRSTLRRITVDPLRRLNATSERVARLSLADLAAANQQSLALTIQRLHEVVFDVEAVSSEFLGACSGVFQGILEDFQSQIGNARKAYDLGQQFLSRLVAVYFFQEEGWLGKDPQFMTGLWQAYCESECRGDTFASEWLEVLFSQVFCGRPKSDSDAWRHLPQATRHALAAAPCFGQLLSQQVECTWADLPAITDARLRELLGLLEAQRYTVREPTPLDHEVALDPAIVGLLHENLAALSQDAAASGPGKARQLRGIYYTPPMEIDLMCRLSLVDWLGNHLGRERKPHLYRAAFAFDAREKEQADEALAARKLWSSLRALLRSVKVLDPACGAGAFLLGMLSVLDDLLFRANLRLGVHETAFERKRHIIEKSLYGIDVMQGAVEAAKLRLCLQLAADEADPSARSQLASELASLASNVRCGDSLVRGPDEISPDPCRGRAGRGAQGALFVSGRGLPTCFDVVIGNPPYVRQELIRDPGRNNSAENPAGSQQYKSQLARSVYLAWPRTFRYDSEEDQAQWRLQARSDLFVYFYLQSLSMLDANGTLCFLTSNAWLDARYGRDLREFLLTRGEVRLIIGNSTQRSFFSAEVNTVIGLLGPATDSEAECLQSLRHVARFLTLDIPFDQALCPGIWEQVERTKRYHATPEWRVLAVRQAVLLHNSQDPRRKRGLGDQWGGQYLRAPHIYWILQDRCGDKLKRIGEIADVRRGITTGANSFFFLNEHRLAEWGIEEEFLARVLKSPRGHGSVWLEIDQGRPAYVFLCHRERDELRGTRALDYIRSGEALGYHLRATCMGRRRWYDLGHRSGALVHCNYLVDKVMRFFASEHPLLASDSFQEIHCAMEPTLVAAAGNSAVCQLSANVLGRSSFGGGLLKVQTYEVEDLLIPDPALLGRDAEQSFRGAGLLALDGLDRCALDGVIFDALGLTTGEQLAVNEALSNLVAERLAKARRSASPGALAGAQGEAGGR